MLKKPEPYRPDLNHCRAVIPDPRARPGSSLRFSPRTLNGYKTRRISPVNPNQQPKVSERRKGYHSDNKLVDHANNIQFLRISLLGSVCVSRCLTSCEVILIWNQLVAALPCAYGPSRAWKVRARKANVTSSFI